MLPLSMGLTYRSQMETIGPVGAGWFASWDKRIYYSSGADEIILYSGSGRIDTFTLKSGGTAGEGPYVKSGFFLEIDRDDNNTGTETDDEITVRYAHGSMATYTPIHTDIAGDWVFRETEFSDRYGNAIECVWNGKGQLSTVRGDMYDSGMSTTRYKLAFDYGNDGRLITMQDYADYTGQQSVIGSSFTGPREWNFVYNSDAQLIEIKLPHTENYYSDTKGSNYRTRVQFTYDSGDNMLEVIDARQANETSPIGWLKNHYSSGKVDYQDVGRTSSGDTTHRQYIVYDSATDVSVVNAEQHRSQYLLNADGTLDEVKHYTGTWDTDATVISATPAHTGDPSYFRTQYEYDTEFHVIEVIHPRGNVSKLRYDIAATDRRSRGNLLRVLSHPGSISTSTLPADQVNGLLATFTYTSASQFNLLATSVNPRAYVLSGSYDIVNNTGITTNNASLYTTTNTYYFSHGTYPDGTLQKTTTPTVDDAIFVGSLNDNQYLETVFTYNSFGQVVTSTDQAGVETTFVYGSSGFNQGYLTQVQAGSQTTPLVTEFAYNSVGRAITVEDAKGYVYTSYVNQLDQVVRSETPQVSAQMSGGSAATYYTRSGFDLNGNVNSFFVSNINEHGGTGTPSEIETEYTYNILDMVTAVTEDIDASTTRTTNFTYDKIFRLTETSLPEGNLSGVKHDELNRPYKSFFGYGGGVAQGSALVTSEVFFDDNSNAIKAVDGRGNDSHYTYDAYDRLFKSEDRKSTDPNWTEYTYNPAGQVTEVVRKGHKRVWNGSSYAWDTYGAILGETRYHYDNLGRLCASLVRAEKAAGSALGYSSLENTTNAWESGWATSRVKFRSNGQVERVRDDLGYEIGYEYDNYNRLKQVIDDRDAGTTGPVAGSGGDNYDEYTYDANGNVTSLTAHLFDDRGSSGNKTLTTTFAYDELNRLKSDTSPSVTTLAADGSLTTGALVREFKYDSRSNLVRTYDRKNVERVTTYDLLNRPIRHKVSNVVRRTIDSSGHIGTVTEDIVSRTVYDKNSNVIQSIGPNGNRTYFRYDLAERWLQTQHADGGTGTPLKTTAGSGHTITAVGSTVFYSKSGARDGNGNLLTLTDENDTEIDFTYDENDLLTDEDGTPDTGNPFNIEGETGMEYLYDGLYRSIYGKTHDGTNTLTEVDSIYNSLGGLEQQRQRILRAHPNNVNFSRELTLVSHFDEMGRRHRRDNPSGLTRVSWDFDRKHRPVEELVEINTGTWQTGSTAAEYEYLGGGFLHSRQTRYMRQNITGLGAVTFSFVSNFERDNLLRLTQVRHHRDDHVISYGERLIGRYDYAYNENSMMAYEARWYHDDQDGTSDVPEESDLYFYNAVDDLEAVTYGATKYGNIGGGATIISGTLDDAYAVFGDDTNHAGTFSDRMYYARRKSGTRDKVNWYRGAATGTSNGLAARNDTNTAPEQTTNYTTSDDPNADPDSPASDGEGSRHNYEVIGQAALQWDKKRNLIGDATREFRYNYRSQLRRVIRKSDGADIAKYREDAYSRRVQAVSYWELGDRVYFDTRFERVVVMDDDNDATDLKYVDGGITSDNAPGPGQADQIAAWPSRLDAPIGNATHYVDFHVDVPDVGGSSAYLGFVAYENYEIRIYGNRYERWATGGGSAIETYYPTGSDTKGRHNIGIGAPGLTWVDGVQIMGGAVIQSSPEIRFGTHDIGDDDPVDGLVLLECLTYHKSLLGTAGGEPVGSGGGGGGRVTLHFFDGPQPVTTEEVYDPILPDTGTNITAHACIEAVNTTELHRIDANGDRTPEICLPNGRRATGQVVRPASDAFVNDEDDIVPAYTEEPLPGVAMTLVTDAVGGMICYGRPDPGALANPDGYVTGSSNTEIPCFGASAISVRLGKSEKTYSTTPSSDPEQKPECTETDIEQGEQGNTDDGTQCACRADDKTTAGTVVKRDESTSANHDSNNGNEWDESGVMFGDEDVPDVDDPEHPDFGDPDEVDSFKLKWDWIANDILDGNEAKDNRLQKLQKAAAENVHQYDTSEKWGSGPDGKTRQYNKYDAIIIGTLFRALVVLGIDDQYTDTDFFKLVNIIKAIAWEESGLGYGSGWRDKDGKYGEKNRWIDTEDCMQVANPADGPSDHASNAPHDSETGKKARGLRAKIWEMFEHGTISKEVAKKFPADAWKTVPKDLTYKNIKGDDSFFYGILWFLHKLKQEGADLGKGLPSDDIVKKGIQKYNSGDHEEEYRDRVWDLFRTGKWKGKAISKHDKSE